MASSSRESLTPTKPTLGFACSSSPQESPSLPSKSEVTFTIEVSMATPGIFSPVFGCVIDANARVVKKGFRGDPIDGQEQQTPNHEILYEWYRELVGTGFSQPSSKVKCSMHPHEDAFLRCNKCVQLKLPVRGSYHCSLACFEASMKQHKKLHSYASGKPPDDNKYTSYSRLISDRWSLLNKPKTVRNGKKWVMVCSEKSYVPMVDDIGCQLMLVTRAVDSSTSRNLCENDLVSDRVLYPTAKRPRSLVESLNNQDCGVKFSVLTYNLLANLYAYGSGLYDHCPNWVRSWEYRQQNLLNEVLGYSADILCLQEVQSNDIKKFFRPELEKCGYNMLFKRKRNEYYTSDGHIMDGCAIFYRRDVFREVKRYERAFDDSLVRVIGELQKRESADPDEAFQKLKEVERDTTLLSVMEAVESLNSKDRAIALRRMAKDNIAVVVILEKIEAAGGSFYATGNRICVANTHIFADEEFPDVKLFQVVDLMTGLGNVSQLNIPVVVCGDFNTTPLSVPHRYITAGGLDVLPKEADPFGICQNLKLEHSLRLKSAYQCFCNLDVDNEHQMKFDSETKEPKFTHSTSKFKGTLDYIFFTDNKLAVDAVLELLGDEDLEDGIPSCYWSSDHIALMARFVFALTSLETQDSQAFPDYLWPSAAE